MSSARSIALVNDMKKLALLLLVVSVAGCSLTDRHPALPPSLPKIPPRLMQRCPDNLIFPDRALTVEEAAAALAWFRLHYGACARKDGKLIDAATIIENLGRKQ